MDIDMSRFHQGFFDEVGEHLETLERIMLDLDIAAPSRDELDALFRVAHSIKGGSGTFGFSEMAAFTHVLESLLDKVRIGELPLTDRLVDLTLRAGDVLRGQLQHYRDNAPLDSTHADAVAAELKAALAEAASGPPAAPAQTPVQAAPLGATPGQTQFSITFTCNQAEPARSSVHLGLRSALGALGQLELASEADANPWNYVLRAACTEAELHDVFSFVQLPEDELEIVAQTPNAMPATSGSSAFGFFDDELEIEVAPAMYGFFEDVAGTPAGVQAAPEASAAPATAPSAGAAPPSRAKSTDAGTIRVNLEKVDGLINLVGEMVIAQAMLAQIAGREGERTSKEMSAAIEQIQRHTRELREGVMSIRMIPMSFIFSRFPRMVRELAGKLGKEVSLVTVGDDTELDKGLIENIVDPLTHLVRNSLDHGIEVAAVRTAAGKDRRGTITLRSSHQGGNVVIEIIDDGRGLDRERILEKARSAGMAVSAEMPDAEVWQLIFAPGLSTADKVTDLSGRGVGMDVVKRNIIAVGGRVEISSQRNAGTHVTIRLPLTLAILDGLSVRVGTDVFIIPLSHVVESVQPNLANIKPIAGRGDVFHFRGEYIPIVPLHMVFALDSRDARYESGIFVVIETGGTKAAIFVDALDSQHQVVIKSLERNFRRVDGIAGATSLGDGRVSLILDCESLLRIGGVLGTAA